MLVSLALLVSTALATPESVSEATRLHLDGQSVEAAELILPEIDGDPAAALALGRIFFAHSQWAPAEAAYHRIPRDSPLWFRSRLEATWAAYYLDPTHERAIARALLLYSEDPTDLDLRYLIGILMLQCDERSAGVQDRTEALLRGLVADLKADGSHTPPSGATEAAEILLNEISPEPKMEFESGRRPEACAFFVSAGVSTVQRAVILTLTDAQDHGFMGSWRRPTNCAVHPRCPDPKADRKRDREATRWLSAYRKDLD